MSPLTLCRFAQTAAAILLAGTAVLSLLARGTNLGPARPWNRLAFGAWAALLITNPLHLWLTTAAMSGLPLTRCLSGEMLLTVLADTSFGTVWQVRAALLAALLPVLWPSSRARQSPPSAPRDLARAALAAALLASLVWTGHTHSSPHHAWLLPVNLVHIIAAGAWPGGLLPLALLLARARRNPQLVPAAVAITRRFSRLSVLAVALLALTGLINAYGLIGTLAALWPSPYGRLLLCKIALFAAMVGLGAINRHSLRPTTLSDPAATFHRLRRNVACECVLAVGVLLATEALATSVPPATETPPLMSKL